MTNTNDFRKYTSYQPDPIELINSFSYTRGAHAPKIRPEVQEPERDFRVRSAKGVKSNAQLIQEQKASRAGVIKIAVAAVICLVMIGLVINSLAIKNQLTRQIAAKETAIANAQSENISLESELEALVSINMIDKYAVEKLGMSKVSSSQVEYVDVEEYKAERSEQQAQTENEVINN